MKSPHKKYTYAYHYVIPDDDFAAIVQPAEATHIRVYRRQIKPDSIAGMCLSQRLLDIPLSEVQLPAPTPAKHQPRTKAELIASLRHLSEDMSDLFEAMRYFAQDSHDISEWCRQLSNLAILPKAWAEMLEEGNAK